jgi:lysozyme
MKASSKCIELIKQFEGFYAKPYLCPAKVPTIGYGSTRYADGRKVTMNDTQIGEQQAIDIMKKTLESYERDVLRYVKVSINQNQFDALVDFAYNVGSKNLLNSTLLKKLNAMDWLGASKEFGKWIYADGKKLNGLIARREAERILFASM